MVVQHFDRIEQEEAQVASRKAHSTPELDALVEIAHELPGVLGSRLTGGGFGGATVTLLERDHAQAVKEALVAKYHERTGYMAQAHLCEIADGAH